MVLTTLVAMVRKDLQIFVSDRRAVVMAFAMPIIIASFFGLIFSPRPEGQEAARIPAVMVDQDGSGISKSIVAGVASDRSLSVRNVTPQEARDLVRRGSAAVGIVIPAGFGDAAGRAFFGGGDKPQVDLLYDPSHSAELAMVRGLLTQHVMEAVSREMFGGQRGRQLIDETIGGLQASQMPDDQKALLRDMLTSVQKFSNSGMAGRSTSAPAVGISMPYTVREDAVTGRPNASYNGFAHSFAGMGVQFALFAALNFGVEILLERQRGLWKRLRSAPVSRLTLLVAKMASCTAIGFLVLLSSFAFAILVWGVRIEGSTAGFLGILVACALMAAAYGLLIASLGKTPNGARAAAIPATLVMVMLGGAWVPTFIFPAWLQRITVVVPTRWAVDGLDAMTWRGLGFESAIMPILVMLGFTLAFLALARARFRWEET